MARKTAQPTGPQVFVKPVRHHTGPLTSANIAGYECFTQDTPPAKIAGPRFDATRHGGLYGLYTDALADMQGLGYVPVPQFSHTRALVRF